ncbi:MAG: flagellar basal body-associated FliL family protein [Desulfobacula sp.]|jgi:flagellar FliL protein
MAGIFILDLKALFVTPVVGEHEKYGIPGTGIAFHQDTADNKLLLSGALVTTKTLKDMRNDLDDDSLDDIAASSSDKKRQSRINSLKAVVSVKIKGIFKKLFSSKKMIMITAGSSVLFISLVVVGTIFLSSKNSEKAPEKVKDTHQDKAVKEEGVKKASVHLITAEIVFEDIVVLKPFEHIQLKEGSNLKNISMNLSLELSDNRYKKEVQAMEEKIRQIIEEQLGGMTWLELRNPEGKIMLKYELLKQMNSIFSEVMIRNIYFTKFLMQR